MGEQNLPSCELRLAFPKEGCLLKSSKTTTYNSTVSQPKVHLHEFLSRAASGNSLTSELFAYITLQGHRLTADDSCVAVNALVKVLRRWSVEHSKSCGVPKQKSRHTIHLFHSIFSGCTSGSSGGGMHSLGKLQRLETRNLHKTKTRICSSVLASADASSGSSSAAAPVLESTGA